MPKDNSELERSAPSLQPSITEKCQAHFQSPTNLGASILMYSTGPAFILRIDSKFIYISVKCCWFQWRPSWQMPAHTDTEPNLPCNHPGHEKPRGILAGYTPGLIVSVSKRECIRIALASSSARARLRSAWWAISLLRDQTRNGCFQLLMPQLLLEQCRGLNGKFTSGLVGNQLGTERGL